MLCVVIGASPASAQVTSGSTTVLPGGAPSYRPGPGYGVDQVPADWVPPVQRPTGPGRVMATTPVNPTTVVQESRLPETTAGSDSEPAQRSGVGTVMEFNINRSADTRPSPGPSTTVAEPAAIATPAPAQPPAPAATPDRFMAESSIGPSEAGQAAELIAAPEPQPEPQPLLVPEPVITQPAPEVAPEVVVLPEPEPEPEPELERQPITQPAPEMAAVPEPSPAPVAVPRRFDNLPAEGARIGAYDELLASGVEAAESIEAISELDALQLREWMAQMRQAVEDHPSVRVAMLQAEASEAGVNQARAARLPQITLSSEVGNDRSVRDGGDPTSAGGIPEERDVQITPTLDASLLLFDAGATRAGIEAAERRVEAGDVGAEAASDTIAFRAAQTLINLATLRAQITLAEDNLTQVRRLRAMIQERADAGRDSPSDMFRMNSRVQEARNTLEQRVAQFNAARATYAEVFRSEPIVLGLPPAYAPVPSSARSAIDRAVQRNPELRQAEALAQAAQREFESRRAAIWPQLSLGASVTGYDITREGEDYYDSFIGLRLNAPLFDGGSRRAQIDQAQREANLEQARVDELRANIVRAMSEAYSGRASLQPQLMALEAQVEANEATLAAYEEQFFTGRRPLNDLVTAQRELYAARAELLDLRGELHLQHFTIRRLTGDLLSDYGLPEGRG